MRNSYRITGDEVFISMQCHSTKTTVDAVINLSDLPLVSAHSGTWYAAFARKSTIKRYVFGKKWVRDVRKCTTIGLHRLIMEFPSYDVNHLDNDGLNNRRSNLNTLKHIDNMRYRWPNRDWKAYDAAQKLAEEYRKERDIARAIQAEYSLCRQQLWKIRVGHTRGNTGHSPAAVAYHAAITSAGIRPFELLKAGCPRGGKWGAVKGV